MFDTKGVLEFESGVMDEDAMMEHCSNPAPMT
jgi:hypothetical protein